MYYSVGEEVEVEVSKGKWESGVVVGVDAGGRYSVRTRSAKRVHVAEAASTLSFVCGGSRETKVNAALGFFAEKGYLTLENLTMYLLSTFKVFFEAFPEKKGETCGLDIARASAHRAFLANDIPVSGLLPVEKFREWYSSPEEERLEAARLELRNLEISEALEVVSKSGGDKELKAGLSIFCKGSGPEKIRATFHLFDADGSGFLDSEELRSYLTSVFEVALASNSALRHRAKGADATALGQATAAQILKEADKDHDGFLSFEEFEAWFQRQSKQEEHEARMKLLSILKQRDAKETILFFKTFETHGKLTRNAFYKALDAIDSEKERGDAELFELFDVDDDGYIDSKELAAGLTTFCGGPKGEGYEILF